MNFLADPLPSWAILILIVGFFSLIALVVFLVSKFVPGIKKEDEVQAVDEQTRIQEELDRVLVPIEEEKSTEDTEDAEQDVESEQKPTDE